MKYFFLGMLLCFGGFGFAQNASLLNKKKTVAVAEVIQIDSLSIQSNGFLIQLKDKTEIDTSYYNVDFSTAKITLKKAINSDSIDVFYKAYPEFLTKTYKVFDTSVIVENTDNTQRLFRLSQSTDKELYTPFDGLNTSGSIARGVTIGNNQNAVLNSALDLQITGKLNDKVTLRASIQDANIPLQESGYSQQLDEFDQVFIELFSDTWNIRAGDIDLVNPSAYFSSFSKRVQGLSLNLNLGKQGESRAFASGAIVRGQFTNTIFVGDEGNQGPYKLKGSNGELYVQIISGSETVYVNGIALKRGEHEDYIIDYNAGEIIFNATYPITSEMRIRVDYQYSERNYSRLVVFGGGEVKTEKLKISASVYSENDSKNQPLQQNLSTEQVQLLGQAGDNSNLMVSPSATLEAYNENRILYKKEQLNGEEVFVFSNNPEDTLYSVTFSLVGEGNGDYELVSTNAISNIYEYSGVLQGSYAPITQLVAPTKLQIAELNGSYNPSEKTQIDFDISASKNDLNLFSELDDTNNDGFASHIGVTQTVFQKDSTYQVKAFVNTDIINTNFRTIEGLYNPEFSRDWNIDQTQNNQISSLGNTVLTTAGITSNHSTKGQANYSFEHLKVSNYFNGNKHNLNGNLKLNRLSFETYSSLLHSDATLQTSTFLRSRNTLRYELEKTWFGAGFETESNKQNIKSSGDFTEASQAFKDYKTFVGYGDKSAVFAEVGYTYRTNDSVVGANLQRVTKSNTMYLDSKLIQNQNTNLSLFANYRTLAYEDASIPKDQSLNSRVLFHKKLIKNSIVWQTTFETNAGSIAQQDFTYVEVEPGQGVYTWIDYNGNGIQELDEFETAQFQDEASFLRVLLPHQTFIKTHQNKLSQSLIINPSQWQSTSENSSSFWQHWHNQTTFLIDKKTKREGSNFNLNPFKATDENTLGAQKSIRNVLFFNRGKPQYSTSYTYLNSESKNVLQIGYIENSLKSHQLQLLHKIKASWLFNLKTSFEENRSETENFESKNYTLNETRLFPKLSYILSDNTTFDVFYQLTNKENKIGALEHLEQQQYGVSFAFTPDKNPQNGSITGEFSVFNNAYTGNANTPVAYQILEGLQPGKNFTWQLFAQKKLTKYLDLNLNYLGRKTPTSNTIHTGNVQLKAYF